MEKRRRRVSRRRFLIEGGVAAATIENHSRPNDASGCVPYPLDILAINTIYQEDYE